VIIQVPRTDGSGSKATVSVEYQPQEPTWPYGGQTVAFGTMQARVQGLSDFTGNTTKQRQPPPVIQADALALTNLGTET
jgi:hypothetical protein